MNIFGMGPMEIMLILILGLIVFGPGKLPEVMGQVGKAVRDFRRATSELSEEFNRTIQSEIDETKAAVQGTSTQTTQARPTTPAPLAPPPPTYSNGTSVEVPPAPVVVATPEVSPSQNGSVPNTILPPQPSASTEKTDDDLVPPY
jgi:TatA/E family protein of Tat protein translocase